MTATESIEKKRLRWLCRRGMKELDVLLSHYMEVAYDRASGPKQAAFARLLEYQDPELYALILDNAEPADTDEADVVAQLRRHAVT